MARTELALQFGRGTSIAPLDDRTLTRLVRAAAGHDWRFTLRLATRAEATQLNRQFRGADYAPNVLTFPYPDIGVADIVVCTAVVREQAREQRKRFADHLAHMVVHGALHAIGHTHDGNTDARRMETLERQILARFGIDDPYR
ncbi:MAG: rRNA maturation RNase YbeY [Burkholderiaceae bacterium]